MKKAKSVKSDKIKKIVIATATLFVCCVVVLVLQLTLGNRNSLYEDLSHLDGSSVQGYENGSFVNGGEYLSTDVKQPNSVPLDDKTAYAKETTQGATSAVKTFSSIGTDGKGSGNLNDVVFNINNVSYGYYYTGDTAGNKHDFGTGFFGADLGDFTQGTQQKNYLTWVKLDGDLLKAAKTGNLKVTMTRPIGMYVRLRGVFR